MSEEERRRRCIIDPTSCGSGNNAPVNQLSALADELQIAAGHEDDSTVNFHLQAKRMLDVFSFTLKPEHVAGNDKVIRQDGETEDPPPNS